MNGSERIVTAIAPVDKKRFKVFLNEEFAFVLYKGELHTLGIAEGARISQLDYDRIKNEILSKRAKLRAMNLLKARSYTEKQLYDKLQQGYYPRDIIEQTLDYVKSFHYIDDGKYARDYIAYHASERPAKRLENDLQKRGIDKEIAAHALQDFFESTDALDECQMIKRLLEKKKIDPNGASWEEKQKTCAALMRKGFHFESIRRVLLLDIT